ncbi:MAG: hypothetical protein GY913_15715 [Proteobacteria bacterium]|nr:hypothetical protein [Pseudomonadota bacterium]
MRHKKSLPLPDLFGERPARTAPSKRPAPKSSRRFLVAHLPNFRLERCGWRADEPVVLLAEEKSALRVQALSDAAHRLGIRLGMAIAEARVLADEDGVKRKLHVELATDPVEEQADLMALARVLDGLSPELRALDENSVVVELTRVDRSERDALEMAIRVLEGVGHACHVVIADEPAAARALAATARRHDIIGPGGVPDALAQLPLSALEPEEKVRISLQSVGVLRVGQLAALPASSVAGRFGGEGLRLHHIARGTAPLPPLTPDEAGANLVLRRQLPDAVEQLEAILLVLNDLSARLQQALSARERAAVHLQIRLGIDCAPMFLLPIRLGQPRRGARELMEVFRKRLEGVRLAGAVTDVSLEVLEDVVFTGRQRGLLDRRDALESLPDLLGRLADTLGEESIFAPSLAERHRPELSWATSSFRVRPGKPERAEGPPRPGILLRDPLPVRVELGSSAPVAIEIEGRWSRVDALDVPRPERLCGGWWEDPFDRDYHAGSLSDGRRPWFFLDRETGQWWLHGWWD